MSKRTKIRLAQNNNRGRERKKEPGRQEPVTPNKVHDRRAETLLLNANVAITDVDDPWGENPGDKVRVFRSIRHNPLAAMWAAGQLHSDPEINEILNKAGEAWQDCYERSQIGSLRATNPANLAPQKNCGLRSELDSDDRIRSANKIAHVAKALGTLMNELAFDVLASGLTLRDAAAKRGLFGAKDIKGLAWSFRAIVLPTIAVVFGLMNRPEIPHIADED